MGHNRVLNLMLVFKTPLMLFDIARALHLIPDCDPLKSKFAVTLIGVSSGSGHFMLSHDAIATKTLSESMVVMR